jgi:hypothetical protein
MVNNQETAMERPEQDKFLALIEKVIVNKEVDADKLRVLVDLQIQLEDRQAEKAFDADMIEAQSEVRALAWDKLNTERNSRNVSYPKIDTMLRPIRLKYGFTQTWDSEPSPMADMMVVCCDVIHRSGHRRRYRLPMPIDNMGPKGGSGVMTKQQAVVSGSSYGIRKLASMIWDIPLLVDKDDNDGNPVRPPISDAEKSNLEKMMKGFSDARKQWLLDQFGISELSELPKSKYNNAVEKINLARKKDDSKHGTINADQEATLVALIDEVGGSCKADFLKTNQIKTVGELPTHQYQGALAALTQLRRK